jgi:hypothetical protein
LATTISLTSAMTRACSLFLWVVAIAALPYCKAYASEQQSTATEALDDAWWTGPLLAASPATLPQGHVLVEPYIFDAIAEGNFDSSGTRHAIPRQSDYGSLAFLLYGLADTITLGAIPRIGFNDPGQGQRSSGIGVGDITLQGAYRLARFLDQGWLPAMSFVVGETLPTGRYDQLGDRPSLGMGAGAYTTTLSLYSQYYLWMPNGRILRTRLDVSQSWSSSVDVEDVSVYGTTQGFRGQANPGNSTTIDSAWEYSMTRNWVAALDIAYLHSASTRLSGRYLEPFSGKSTNIQGESGSSYSLSLAPAIEYNWSGTVGVIVGAKWVAAGRNTGAAIVPVAAINLVF